MSPGQTNDIMKTSQMIWHIVVSRDRMKEMMKINKWFSNLRNIIFCNETYKQDEHNGKSLEDSSSDEYEFWMMRSHRFDD
jgi:hypothetical protein